MARHAPRGYPRHPDRGAPARSLRLSVDACPARHREHGGADRDQQRPRGGRTASVRGAQSRSATMALDRGRCRGEREPRGQRGAWRAGARRLRPRRSCATCRNGRWSGEDSHSPLPPGGELGAGNATRASWPCSPSAPRCFSASLPCLRHTRCPRPERRCPTSSDAFSVPCADRGQHRRPSAAAALLRAGRRFATQPPRALRAPRGRGAHDGPLGARVADGCGDPRPSTSPPTVPACCWSSLWRSRSRACALAGSVPSRAECCAPSCAWGATTKPRRMRSARSSTGSRERSARHDPSSAHAAPQP